MNFETLKKELNKVELKDNVVLSECEFVTNGKKFVESHIKIIEMTEGKSNEVKRRLGLPFYRRLENYLKCIC